MEQNLKKFNWGAFLLNWIWGIFHGKYITLLYFPACLIPLVGPLLISTWFGCVGNKWAWDSKSWSSVEEFNRSQRFWVKLWFILAILSIIITVKVFLFLVIVANIQI
ncbi:MAG: ribonuclease G [Cyanobacteria bacterium SIG26]|nr:ribonuclease G [Cyanobacteria bacterium SIG26]